MIYVHVEVVKNTKNVVEDSFGGLNAKHTRV